MSKIGVVGHPKMINSELAACFAVAGVQICLLDTNNISSSNICTTAKQAALSKKQSLKHHIWSKSRVVGYPKTMKLHGGLLIGYKKAFFSQHMNDGKSGGPIEKSNLLGIIFALQLWLWVIQR